MILSFFTGWFVKFGLGDWKGGLVQRSLWSLENHGKSACDFHCRFATST